MAPGLRPGATLYGEAGKISGKQPKGKKMEFFISYDVTDWIKTEASSIDGAKRAARERRPLYETKWYIGVKHPRTGEILCIMEKDNRLNSPYGNNWHRTCDLREWMELGFSQYSFH